MDKYNERPQIARVKELKGDKIRVEWFHGSWSGKWRQVQSGEEDMCVGGGY